MGKSFKEQAPLHPLSYCTSIAAQQKPKKKAREKGRPFRFSLASRTFPALWSLHAIDAK